MFALLAAGVAGLAWLGADPTPATRDSPALTNAAGVATPAAVEPALDVEPRTNPGTPAANAGISAEAHAMPSPAATEPPPGDAELERVGAALAREPALIDALEDATSHPDPVVRAEAEALVAEALERARARATAPAPEAP
jgi:hypothetical protein